MADTYLRMTYVLELTDKEMRLACLCLAGKHAKLSNADKKDAAELNAKLLKAQQIRLKEQLCKVEGAIAKADEEMTWPVGPDHRLD